MHFVLTYDSSLSETIVINAWINGFHYVVDAAFQDWENGFSGDAFHIGENLSGKVHEFRIYRGLLNRNAVLANEAAGPEVVLGQNPRESFAITSVSRDTATGAITLVWSSQAGKSYAVSQSESLATGTWSDLPGTIASGGTSTSVTFTPPAGQTVRYYRIKEL